MPALWYRYSFAWVTLGFFLITLIGHWLFGWFAYLGEQQAQGRPPDGGEFVIQMLRDTLENWQSELLQLIWQVMGLALLLHVGSPQSKEGDDRVEAKIDAILRAVDRDAEAKIQRIDTDYMGRETDEQFMKSQESKAAGGG